MSTPNVKLQWATPDIERLESISDKAIVLAYRAGYMADDNGNIFSPRGKILKGGITKQGYRTFTPAVYPAGRRSCILQHRFVAYCKFGPAVFDSECVRHVNDVPHDNRYENLLLGTYQQNAMDMPPEKRRIRSQGAGERIVAINRKLTPSDVTKMRNLRATECIPYKRLAIMFGVTAMTAHRAVNKQSWSLL